MGRRQFAKDPEKVRHFKLVARAQRDANADDPDATPLVLEPFVKPGAQQKLGIPEDRLLEIPESLRSVGPEVFGLGERRNDEPRGSRERADTSGSVELEDLDDDCYFPKDGYNYEQHLKRVSGTGKGGGVVGVVLDAPQKKPEKEITIQAAETDEQAEVIAALENADDYEELEDGAIEEIIPGGVIDSDVVLWGPTAIQDRDLPDLDLFRRMRMEAAEHDEDANDEEGVRRRDDKGAGVDEGDFEDFLDAEYGDDEIGACEDDDIEGHITLEGVEPVLDDYIQGKKEEFEELRSLYEPKKGWKDDDVRVIEETRAIIERHYLDDVSGDETTSGDESAEDESKNWDCETVLSNLSNLSNRPGKIGKIKVLKKPDLKPVSETGAIAEEDDDDEDGSGIVEIPDAITTRSKDETPEEKKARKASVKEMRRVCRQMKKESKQTYRQEATKLAGQKGGADLRQKLRTTKL